MVIQKGDLFPELNHVKKAPVALQNQVYTLCPGKGYKVPPNRRDINFDLRLGQYHRLLAGHSIQEKIYQHATSGGLMTALGAYLLDTGIIDGVLTVKFTPNSVVPIPFVATNIEELLEAQGSKYIPVPLLENLQITAPFKSLLVVGTPCQIAASKALAKSDSTWSSKVVLHIANFCGGYRNYNETRRLLQIGGVKPKSLTSLKYRANGQPGFFEASDGVKTVTYPYPNYSRLTGHTKVKRCRLCIDATGELADISFGDAWEKDYLSSGKKWSFLISRNERASQILNDLQNSKFVHLEGISEEQLIRSQFGNIQTKKSRQRARYRLSKICRETVPVFDLSEYPESSLGLELKVRISHAVMQLLEHLGLYTMVSKILKRR